MRNPQQPRRRWPGPVTGLLLALALAACPGGDDTPQPGTAGGDSAQLRLASGPAGDTTCTPPPSPPDSLLRNGASWSALEQWLAANNVSFPEDPANVSVDTVPLCKDCSSVGLRLQATNSTFCLKPADSGQLRIAGRMTVLQTYLPQAPPLGIKDTIPAGSVVYMFSRGTPAAVQLATLVYAHADSVREIKPGNWRFYYCPHDTVITHPAAQWRPEDSIPQQQATTADVQGEEGGGSYAWMSCANGCCQFYTPPPMQEFPDLPEVGRTPNEQPGNGRRLPIPKWCQGGSDHP